jgi:hypothetical protein
MKRILATFVLMCAVVGCKDATRAQYNALGRPHKITVYSSGVAVKTYYSTGNVSNSGNSDGWYFENKETGKLVEVAGTIVIEAQ